MILLNALPRDLTQTAMEMLMSAHHHHHEKFVAFAGHLHASKIFSLSSCVMLFYDIAITFGDEVEKIWLKPFTVATVLWIMNRYLPALGYIVVIVSFHAHWKDPICDRYVLFPEVLKLFTTLAIGIIFILRLYAIYGRSKTVVGAASCLLGCEIIVKIWAFTDGTRLPLPPMLAGCILTGRSPSLRFAFTWISELIFDTVISAVTVGRTLVIYRKHRHGGSIPLIKVMMRDGVIYFVVIFISNLVTVLCFAILPIDLKAVNASFSSLITNIMVSRMILNLRDVAYRSREPITFSDAGSPDTTPQSPTSPGAGQYNRYIRQYEPTSSIISNPDDWEHIVHMNVEEHKGVSDFAVCDGNNAESSNSSNARIIPRIVVQVSTEEDTSSDYFESCISDTDSTLYPQESQANSINGSDGSEKLSWQPPQDWLMEDGIRLQELGIAV